MKKNLSTYQVFTPSTPAKLAYIERKSIDEKLDRGILTIGKQIVIYGFTGTGKTTIVRNNITNYYKNTIYTQCTKGMDINDILYDAFSQLDVFYTDGKEKNETTTNKYTFKANFYILKAQITNECKEESKEVFKRIIAVKLTPQNLAKFIGDTESCWIIEDFHKIDKTEKEKLSQILKVFMDCSVDYPRLKIITIGAVNTAREIIQYDKEMKNRVTEIQVPLMKNEELVAIIKKGEALLNVKFENRVINKIVQFSSGLPAVTHNLCLIICLNNGIVERNKETSTIRFDVSDLKEMIKEFIKENEDTFQSIYDKGICCKTNRKIYSPKKLLNAIVDFQAFYVSYIDIKKHFENKYNVLNSRKLKDYLNEFTVTERGEILRYHKDTDSYYFANPLFRSYVLVKRFEELEKTKLPGTLSVENISSNLEELYLGKQTFLKDFEDFEDFDNLHEEDE